MKLINTIIHFMNLCDISNGYQLKVDDGFKGYFRVVVDCNYPNYCFINDAWQLIDLAPFFWSVGDHFSSANQQILDMSQSEDYYSFIKSLCTNPAQLYVFFCGRMYRPYQRYSRSTHPHDQKKAREWLGLYNYALRRVASLPQIAHEFDQPQWRALSAFDNKNQDDFWDLLVQQRNSDPSHEYLEGVIELVSQNNLAGRPIILDGAVKQWQQLPTEYSDFIGAMNYVDPVDYLSMTEEQRAGRRLSDIFDLADRFGMDTPEPILPSRADNSEEAAAAASRNQLMEFLRLQALMRTLSQNMAKDNNRRAAQRRRVLQEQRVSNPPPPPAIYTHLTAMNNAEMADYLNLRFNAEYIPVDDDGNCMWAAITRVLRRRGIVINPQDMMQAVLPPGQQEGVPAHQQNWGDTDFTAKILQYLAQLGHHFGIVVIQPYGAEMVAVWYGLENGQLTVLPLGNDPVEIQQAIQNPNNITLVNHQNGNDGEFQVNHWGGVVPIPPAGAGVAGIVMADAAAPEGPVVEYPTSHHRAGRTIVQTVQNPLARI